MRLIDESIRFPVTTAVGVILLVMFGAIALFKIPVQLTPDVVDPTGAGDSFAGGFLGYLAAALDDGDRDYRRAAVAGTIMASFQVEAMSLDRLRTLTDSEIRERFAQYRAATEFENLDRP